jgi:hypothetical protein
MSSAYQALFADRARRWCRSTSVGRWSAAGHLAEGVSEKPSGRCVCTVVIRRRSAPLLDGLWKVGQRVPEAMHGARQQTQPPHRAVRWYTISACVRRIGAKLYVAGPAGFAVSAMGSRRHQVTASLKVYPAADRQDSAPESR